jgi:hypothetical protein
MLVTCFQPACHPTSPAEKKAAAPELDPNAVVSETLSHFKARTFTCTVQIAKVYENNLRYDDDLRLYIKLDGDNGKTLMQVKPNGDRKGTAVLAEVKNKEITSAYRYIPEGNRVVEVNPRTNSLNVVIGGLSIQELQMFQGTSPFEQITVSGQEEIQGQLCYKLDATLIDRSQYERAELFTTVAERLPLLMRVFNKEGTLAKVISIDKLEQRPTTWVVKQITVEEKLFNYRSTFTFDKIQVDTEIPDQIFTIDYLKKGWQG